MSFHGEAEAMQNLLFQLGMLGKVSATVEVSMEANNPILQGVVSTLSPWRSWRLQHFLELKVEVLGNAGVRLLSSQRPIEVVDDVKMLLLFQEYDTHLMMGVARPRVEIVCKSIVCKRGVKVTTFRRLKLSAVPP